MTLDRAHKIFMLPAIQWSGELVTLINHSVDINPINPIILIWSLFTYPPLQLTQFKQLGTGHM